MADIKKISDALGRYYASLGKEYDDLFVDYCDDNGLDEDEIVDELDVDDPGDSLLIDFDEDFPFKKEPKNRAQFIFDMIRKCRDNPDIKFGGSLPEFNQDLFDISGRDLEEIKKLYQTQCPVLWNSGISTDGFFLYILAVGRKHKFDWLLHLVDDYSRDRIRHINESWTEKDWSKNHKLFRGTNIPYRTDLDIKGTTIPYRTFALASVQSFGSRCCPKLLFSNMILINCSLQVTVESIYESINFISNLVNSAITVCPFQVDVCIAVGKPYVVQNIMEDDDDDDDDDDEKNVYIDCIGNIQAKLKKNSLKYKVSEQDLVSTQTRMLGNIYRGFEKENKSWNKSMFDRRKGGICQQRLIVCIDRRNGDEKANVYMYEPPANCRVIPYGAVAEWYISSSRTCLLPNMAYGDGFAAIRGDNRYMKEEAKVDRVTKLKNSNIGVSFHCKGSLLTFSFHVKSGDVIKCYLFWNGQMIRFFPQDIKILLPRMFNMNYKGNEDYLKSKDLDSMIKEMQNKLVDKDFAAFQQSYA